MIQDLISLGFAAQTFQLSPAMIEAGLRAHGAQPQLILNGVAHYRFEDMSKAVAFVRATGKPAGERTNV